MAKIIFIQDIAYEYFGVMCISSYIKKHGHQCDVLIENIESDWFAKLEAENPDIVGFSTLTGSFKWAIAKAALIKKKLNKPIIFGGVHVFSNPDVTINQPSVDIVCTGEGEDSVLE